MSDLNFICHAVLLPWVQNKNKTGWVLTQPVPFAKILPNPAKRLERLNVRCLPTLGPLHHIELHGLAFLQALEALGVDRRVVHEDVFAVLTRDEAEALRVIEPLHSTLFHFDLVS